MKIVHCKYGFPMGGAETLLVDLMNRQIKKHSVYLVLINDLFNDELASKIDSRVKIIRLNRKPGSRSPWFILKLNWLFLLSIRPDVLHLHSYSLPAIIHYPKHKLFATIHDVDVPVSYHKRFHRIFAISQAVYDDIKRRIDLPINTVILASNGIDCEKIKVRPLKFPNAGFGKSLKIVQISRFEVNKKGQDILIEAIRLIKLNYNVKVEVTFIGDGPGLEPMKKLVEEYELIDQIFFYGTKSRDFVYAHLKDFDLLVQPSRFEGFGLTVAEAMAAKIPVLVSNIDGPMELVQSGAYGYYFQSEDPNSLAEMIVYIKDHYDEAMGIANKAVNYVGKTYSIDAMVYKYELGYYDK
ncbi:glycosyltransferase [Porphyromonas gingivalis]|uniref:glycosyltransferase n=1 Tax=Porphyromonas gingivalis TaxID=837 RepID=UPI000BE7707F|nr:glycosyltransferase [Porphyromonas gingivalis]PDP40729.1 glycosyltransferase [Porphyromonas gingivalis]